MRDRGRALTVPIWHEKGAPDLPPGAPEFNPSLGDQPLVAR